MRRRPGRKGSSPSTALRVPLRLIAGACVAVLATQACIVDERATARPFTPDSYWNEPLSAETPVDPRSAELLRWLVNDNTDEVSPRFYIHLAGTEEDGGWGEPVYRADPDDPLEPVRSAGGSDCYSLPPQLTEPGVRIPAAARPAATNDAQMTVYDEASGVVVHLYGARFDEGWTACGGALYRLDSNGLHAEWAECGADPRNVGHRGLPPSTFAVEREEIERGSIDHRLKISVAHASAAHVFPMVGSDGDGGPVPEGTLIRIREDVDPATLVEGAALTVARALQRYGAVVGDQSGRYATLKLENPVVAGAPWRWSGGAPDLRLFPDSLAPIPPSWYQVVRLGYRAGACSD